MIRYEEHDPWYEKHLVAFGALIWSVIVVGITLWVFLR